MLIGNILRGIPRLSYGTQELMGIDVADICADSRQVPENALFFAYKGEDYDSHADAERLYKEGKVRAVVSERALDGVPAILVSSGRETFAMASSAFFGHPMKMLTSIAITGTNGKTTTAYMVEAIFNSVGRKCIRIGTTGASIGDEHFELNNTTPSAYEFHKILAYGLKKGASTVVVELSSHALQQNRLAGLIFDVAVFSNLTGEHLDYHGDMESYYQAKKLLFTGLSKRQVINITHPYGQRLYKEATGERYSCGMDRGDLHVMDYSADLAGIKAEFAFFDERQSFASSLTGVYNLENMLTAAMAAMACGVSLEAAAKGIASLNNVPGRLESYSAGGVHVFVDYAHTDDALANMLGTVKGLAKGKLITVFGAGGNRDKAKRPRMGEVAEHYSDILVITNDNPRNENPQSIIADIIAGMVAGKPRYVELDREKAIARAIELAEAGDAVVVAGKGHEEYQIIGDVKLSFSDSLCVQKYLGQRS